MRIALDARECGDPWTGMGRYALEVARALVRRRRHDYVLVLGAPAATSRAWREIDAERIHSAAPAYALREHRVLPRELRCAGVDALHALTYALPLAPGVPASLTLFDVVPLLYPENYRLRARLYWSLVLKRTAARARFVVTLSQCSRDAIAARLDLDPERIHVLPAGVGSPFRPRADDESVLARLGVARPFLLAHGNQRPHKNLRVLEEAFAQVAPAFPGLTLVLSGGAVEGGGVVRVGRIDDNDLAALYSTCDLYVLPSLYEGAGLTPLEAMACGAPCLLSTGGALGELYDSAAELTSPDAASLAGAIARLLGDDTGREALRERGRALAAARTWERAAAALEVVLDRLSRP